MKVLLAVEGAPTCGETVKAAASRPWPSASIFCLLNVLDPFPFARAPLLLERARAAVRKNLESNAHCLRRAGCKTDVEVLVGNPRRAISNFARDWEADLILIGAHRVSNLMRFLLGSTAQSVLRHSSCSVEIVRTRQETPNPNSDNSMRILIATDASECSLAALRSVAQRPWPKGSMVNIVSIPELILPLREFPYFEPGEVENLNLASTAEAKAAVAAGVKILSGTELNVCSAVPDLQDAPYRVILDAAAHWQADLIVVGSHGRKGFDRITMGSVSEAVALHSNCSVEVIREPKTSMQNKVEGENP